MSVPLTEGGADLSPPLLSAARARPARPLLSPGDVN